MQTFSKAIKLIVPVPTFAFVFENIPIKEAGGELLSDTLIALDKDSFTFLSSYTEEKWMLIPWLLYTHTLRKKCYNDVDLPHPVSF